MKDLPKITYCSALIYRRPGVYTHCLISALPKTYEGRPYCGKHHPVNVAKRQRKMSARHAATVQERKKELARIEKLEAARLDMLDAAAEFISAGNARNLAALRKSAAKYRRELCEAADAFIHEIDSTKENDVSIENLRVAVQKYREAKKS